jgi:hypothetical protein
MELPLLRLATALRQVATGNETMKSLLSRMLLVFALALGTDAVASAQSTQANQPLTNASVVKLVRAGFKEKTIISIIDSSITRFDLAPDRMIELKHSGVTEKIILEMLNHQQGIVFNDDWTGDPFFDQSAANNQAPTSNPKDTQKQGGGNGSTLDIFGSSGSGNSEVHSRGGNASSSGDIVTTGSATVRIIRPPAEAGGAPKLERTPSLTNDSIIELIEAGFSEGTVIRRIERSPVEFDLSPDKVSELRKHSVTPRILAAMKTAMGDDPSKPGTVSNGTPPQQ